MVEIRVEIDGWERVREAALMTVGKQYTGHTITDEWKNKILRSRHSPIRELSIRIWMFGIPRWVADQLVRHNVGVNSFMRTARPDRGNIPRSEQSMDMPTDLLQSYNGQSFLNMMEARLCFGVVSTETRELAEEIRAQVRKIEPILASHCLSYCQNTGRCREFKACMRLGTQVGG